MVRNFLFVLFMAFLVFAFSLIMKRHYHVTHSGHCLYSVKQSLPVENRGLAYKQHYHPQCTLYGGHYLAQQCSHSTGACWCVTREGRKIPGTETVGGKAPAACRLGPVKGWFRKIQE